MGTTAGVAIGDAAVINTNTLSEGGSEWAPEGSIIASDTATDGDTQTGQQIDGATVTPNTVDGRVSEVVPASFDITAVIDTVVRDDPWYDDAAFEPLTLT